MLTPALIRSVCPHATVDYVSAFTSDKAAEIFTQFEISASPERMAPFMANISHECQGMTIVRESGYYRASTLMSVFGVRYKKSPDSDGDGLSDLAEAHAMKPRLVFNYNYGFRLGNEDDGVNDDDGYNYRGGGPLQATGKGFYKWLEARTGIPFGSNPELIEVPEHWPLVAALTWCEHPSAGNMNPFADQGNFEACCRGINTGSPFSTMAFNGWADRVDWLLKWAPALGAQASVGGGAATGIYRYGSPRSAAVRTIQARLNALRYGEGNLTVDGLFGTRTRSAVYDFQLENGLKPDGIVGPVTWGKLVSDPNVRPYPAPVAAMLGVAGLRAAGDPEIKQADRDRAAAVTLGVSGAVLTASNTGALDIAQGLAKDAGAWQSALTTLVAMLKFTAQYPVTIGILIAAILLYRRFGDVVYQKVEKWTRPVGGGMAASAAKGASNV